LTGRPGSHVARQIGEERRSVRSTPKVRGFVRSAVPVIGKRSWQSSIADIFLGTKGTVESLKNSLCHLLREMVRQLAGERHPIAFGVFTSNSSDGAGLLAGGEAIVSTSKWPEARRVWRGVLDDLRSGAAGYGKGGATISQNDVFYLAFRIRHACGRICGDWRESEDARFKNRRFVTGA
jgi:hypothetical protein